jgi:hypothetical protein
LTALGWYPDPENRHELRFHDGARWTRHVADQGVLEIDDVDVLIDMRDERSSTARSAWSSPAMWTDATGAAPATSHSNGNGHQARSSGAVACGWYLDPSRRHELRYHDGDVWTEYVGDADGYSVDPI